MDKLLIRLSTVVTAIDQDDQAVTVYTQRTLSFRFAGSIYANGWNRFIDGAIETGMTSAREVHNF